MRTLNFASDNVVGASRPVLDAIIASNEGAEPSYGEDQYSRRAAGRLATIFETEVAVFLMVSGSATNGLALAAMTPPWGEVFCHQEAHVMTDECGGPEHWTGGAKLTGLPGDGGKITPAVLQAALDQPRRGVHSVVPAALSLTNLTECGTAYSAAETAALAAIAKGHGLKVHMDGARFANALVGQNASPADLTWKAGVDVLCLGATKNGALAAEAIVVFDLTLAETMPFRRMRGGHLLSKGRFIGAQMEAWLADDHWRDLARHANAMARRLADGLRSVPGVRLPWPVDGNEVFAILPEALEQRVKARGLQFHRWRQDSVTGAAAVRPGEVLCRLVASFQTTRELVDEGLARFKAA